MNRVCLLKMISLWVDVSYIEQLRFIGILQYGRY